MAINHDILASDIEKVPIISTMLEVICRTTGMGFAAVARVTHDRWIACSVRDEIQFGLRPGGELKVETTICSEIRDSGQAVVIDNVEESDFCNHHTPRMYGFRSYISMPIVLKTGEFFGTLCAIDPKPADLRNSKTIGMFNLFTELISFHLQSIDILNESRKAVQYLKKELTETVDENRQYRFISEHNLQEPLRKLRYFSNALLTSDMNDPKKTKALAAKIESNAQGFSMMIKDLSDLSSVVPEKEALNEIVDLNKVIGDVSTQLIRLMEEKQVILKNDELPSLRGNPVHMEQLFYHLIHNAIKFSKENVPPIIYVHSRVVTPEHATQMKLSDPMSKYIEILIEDNGRGIEKSQLEKIFDIFTQLRYESAVEGFGIGLAYCRKIARIHGGRITAKSEFGKGSVFSIILPAIG